MKADSKKIQWTGKREELRSLLDMLFASGLIAEDSKKKIPTLAANNFYDAENNHDINNLYFPTESRCFVLNQKS